MHNERCTSGSERGQAKPVVIKLFRRACSTLPYLRLPRGFVYLSLITDAYSRKIVGWAVHETLQTEGPLTALRKALKGVLIRPESLIHHRAGGRVRPGHPVLFEGIY